MWHGKTPIFVLFCNLAELMILRDKLFKGKIIKQGVLGGGGVVPSLA